MGLNIVALTEGELSGIDLWILHQLDQADRPDAVR